MKSGIHRIKKSQLRFNSRAVKAGLTISSRVRRSQNVSRRLDMARTCRTALTGRPRAKNHSSGFQGSLADCGSGSRNPTTPWKA